MDTSRMACRHCGERGYQNIFGHESVCRENVENLPKVTVTHRCGHRSEQAPWDASPTGGAQRIRFERDRDCSDCVIAQYIAAQASRTQEQIAEQRAEARAAFGPGVEVVDVITGERYRS
jgi:hypothetical protein